MGLKTWTEVPKDFFYEVLEIYKDEVIQMKSTWTDETYCFKNREDYIIAYKSWNVDRYWIEGASLEIKI